jgi:hypothetical protein
MGVADYGAPVADPFAHARGEALGSTALRLRARRAFDADHAASAAAIIDDEALAELLPQRLRREPATISVPPPAT